MNLSFIKFIKFVLWLMFVFQLHILLLFWMCIQGSFNNINNRALLLLHFTLLTCSQNINSVNRNNFSGQFELTICAEDIPGSECRLPMQLYQMCYFHQYLLTKRPSFWLSCCTQTILLHKYYLTRYTLILGISAILRWVCLLMSCVMRVQLYEYLFNSSYNYEFNLSYNTLL